MTSPGTDRRETGKGRKPGGSEPGGDHSHWLMIACCVPMLAIAVALVATGTVGIGFLFIAVMCTAMMAAMMAAMSGGGQAGR